MTTGPEACDAHVVDQVAGDDPSWRAFLSKRTPSLFQSSTWCGIVCAEYGFANRALVAMRDGVVVAGIPFARIDDFRGLRHQTFAFSDVCEPLGDEWPLLERWIARSETPWTIRARELEAPLAQDRSQSCVHHEIALDDPSAVRARSHLTHRQFVAQAERAGIRVRRLGVEEGVDVFYELFSNLRKAKFRLLPQGRGFFERVATAYMPHRGCVLAAFANERPIGAIVLLVEGRTLYYKWAASDPSALRYRPNNLLLDRAIEYAVGEGLTTLDLGISEAEGLIHFKRQVGAPRETRVYRVRYTIEQASEPVRRVERTLGTLTEMLTAPEIPLATTQAAGAELYRYFV